MNIKTIFKINIGLIFLQVLPLLISLFSPEFKTTLMSDAFGIEGSQDAILIFEHFALVFGLTVIGIITAPAKKRIFYSVSMLHLM